jgi:hypothetical protein
MLNGATTLNSNLQIVNGDIYINGQITYLTALSRLSTTVLPTSPITATVYIGKTQNLGPPNYGYVTKIVNSSYKCIVSLTGIYDQQITKIPCYVNGNIPYVEPSILVEHPSISHGGGYILVNFGLLGKNNIIGSTNNILQTNQNNNNFIYQTDNTSGAVIETFSKGDIVIQYPGMWQIEFNIIIEIPANTISNNPYICTNIVVDTTNYYLSSNFLTKYICNILSYKTVTYKSGESYKQYIQICDTICNTFVTNDVVYIIATTPDPISYKIVEGSFNMHNMSL